MTSVHFANICHSICEFTGNLSSISGSVRRASVIEKTLEHQQLYDSRQFVVYLYC